VQVGSHVYKTCSHVTKATARHAGRRCHHSLQDMWICCYSTAQQCSTMRLATHAWLAGSVTIQDSTTSLIVRNVARPMGRDIPHALIMHNMVERWDGVHHAPPKVIICLLLATVALVAVVGCNHPGATCQAPDLHVTVWPLCYKGAGQPPNPTKSIHASSMLA
jgi:hypothetical protein